MADVHRALPTNSVPHHISSCCDWELNILKENDREEKQMEQQLKIVGYKS